MYILLSVLRIAMVLCVLFVIGSILATLAHPHSFNLFAAMDIMVWGPIDFVLDILPESLFDRIYPSVPEPFWIYVSVTIFMMGLYKLLILYSKRDLL